MGVRLNNSAVIVTKDEDFANMIARRRDTGGGVGPRGQHPTLCAPGVVRPLIDKVVGVIDEGQRLIELR
ncbi:hypothetical protein GCM10027062_33140 [Nocardioides hungaricus]